MSLIYLKETYRVEIAYRGNHLFEFNVPMPNGTYLFKLNLLEKDIVALANFTTKEEITLESIEENKSIIMEKSLEMHKALEKLMEHIQYNLGQQFGEPRTILNNAFLAINNSQWVPYEPFSETNIKFSIGTNLNEESSVVIQNFLNNNEEPFLALKHLHRAKEETSPRYMIIEAAIAAELAIKEFLSRKYPHLDGLLEDLPSPPLSKLYGSILKKYHGKKYRANAMQEIATMRNKLIHNPKKTEISFTKAYNKVMEVEDAIKFLLKELYPNHPWAAPRGNYVSNMRIIDLSD
ncbi:hypothetical protein [Thalassobacillus devorans]|uniref:hypothetical protein n=1 Tax=Thalassobacillus devorans TaxID=279813 RepID=UPI000A1CC1D2|nr:hypothetical protein [Thalassobacillus devorans]